MQNKGGQVDGTKCHKDKVTKPEAPLQIMPGDNVTGNKGAPWQQVQSDIPKESSRTETSMGDV